MAWAVDALSTEVLAEHLKSYFLLSKRLYTVSAIHTTDN